MKTILCRAIKAIGSLTSFWVIDENTMPTIRYFLVVLLASAAIAKNIFDRDDDLGRLVDPFGPGEFVVNHTAYRQALNLFLDTNVDVYAPNATGNFPIVYFITGIGGIMTLLQ